jgi:hypothetical protein
MAVRGLGSLQRFKWGRWMSRCRGAGGSMSGAGRALPRRLGIGVVPAQGESFPSWVDRMAVRMRTGPGWVVRELGIELMPDRSGLVIPLNYGISMSRRDLEAVHSATGVAPDAVSAMLLSVYDGTVLDLSSLGHGPAGGQVSVREWGLFRGSRCCPDCVAASAGGWQLGGAAACPEHQVLLHGPACAQCRGTPGCCGPSGRSGTAPTPPPQGGCSARPRRRRCSGTMARPCPRPRLPAPP